MENEAAPVDRPADADAERAWPDPDMMRLMELVERIGGQGQQPL